MRKLDALFGFGGDLEGHIRRRFGAGAFDGGNLQTEVDDVVGAVAAKLFEADEEPLVTKLAGHFDAGAGGDECYGRLREREAWAGASRVVSAWGLALLRLGQSVD